MIASAKELTILLVDDEEDVREVLEMSLVDMGYTVHTAESGLEAMQLFSRTTPPIVLTDIKMPGMDGIELLQTLKRENPDIEVVMITGHGDMDLAIKSLKYEATDFITKPVNVDALAISLKRVQDRIIMKRQLKEYTESLEALVREKTQLQDHLSSLGLMIGSISHSIKSLLTGLDGGMYLLESGFSKQDQDQVKDGWDVIKVMVEKIRKLVLDILYYAKDRDLSWERMDVLSFAEDVARAVEAKTKELGIEFVKRFDAAVGEVEIDAGYVHSALMNIIENAIDACLKDTAKADHIIEFIVRQDHRHVIFDVSDNGIGMELATIEKLFTPFFSTKGRKGTGLGLFISNKIIEKHGGEILVKSIVNQGTRFSVRIPKVPPPPVKRRTGNPLSTLTVE